MKLRLATCADALQIAALWNGMISRTLATFTTELKSQAEISALIADRKGAFFVAEVAAGGDLQGFSTFGPFRAGSGYGATVEHTVIVADGWENRGLGRLLVTAAEDAARARGARVAIAAISAANPGAAAFHERLNYVRTGYMPEVGFKRGQWLDLILMQKSLTGP